MSCSVQCAHAKEATASRHQSWLCFYCIVFSSDCCELQPHLQGVGAGLQGVCGDVQGINHVHPATGQRRPSQQVVRYHCEGVSAPHLCERDVGHSGLGGEKGG